MLITAQIILQYDRRPTVYPFDYCLSTKIITGIIFYYKTCMLWINYASGRPTPVIDLDQGTSELELVPRLPWLLRKVNSLQRTHFPTGSATSLLIPINLLGIHPLNVETKPHKKL